MRIRPFLVLTLSFTAIWTLTGGSPRADETLSLSGLPADIEEYLEIQQTMNTPEGAAGVLVLAMLANEQQPALARALFSVSLAQPQLVSGPNGYNGKQPDSTMRDHIDRLSRDPNIARSYILGATPQNGYAPPEGDLKMYMSRNRLSQISEDEVRVYVQTSGAGTPRPLVLKREADGIWRVLECSSLFVGIYRPSS